uniref:Uncharacterized protein n=1 Tax=Medicago truncatula TaxID=3880 RepID=Q2HSN2_MEDTR|nr:hypothetical protein MtrDRAFT_AC151521g1v2 [Medicago truncatula]
MSPTKSNMSERHILKRPDTLRAGRETATSSAHTETAAMRPPWANRQRKGWHEE